MSDDIEYINILHKDDLYRIEREEFTVDISECDILPVTINNEVYHYVDSIIKGALHSTIVQRERDLRYFEFTYTKDGDDLVYDNVWKEVEPFTYVETIKKFRLGYDWKYEWKVTNGDNDKLLGMKDRITKID